MGYSSRMALARVPCRHVVTEWLDSCEGRLREEAGPVGITRAE